MARGPQGREQALGAIALEAGRPAGSGGRSGWNLGTPFFPLLGSGLEGLGAEAMDQVAELGTRSAPKSWSSGLAGEQLGDGAEVVFGGGLEGLEELLGAAGLLLGEMGEGHGDPP